MTHVRNKNKNGKFEKYSFEKKAFEDKLMELIELIELSGYNLDGRNSKSTIFQIPI